ncbi:hypothetical protein FCR2A7T_18830 [Flavobacterium cauense R2A-7]|uniref:TTHB210-like domain-containing protein n=1 Tax=Flavobacterium cauense R2A-7 TaxID=1341154 RepID=V6RZ26_9FLAO|nr:DUF5602 domain-containing protein [Flavobacterium cauense]ESU19721.1 hypothetical protein FCR2A7T_18830 [Flavobacterium cauense R2A-7]KGO79818.1 hypothetical protein Q762_13650 [Flavobacterium cauense R2A-7]TWI09218.1 hypothetical protein IP98_02574 [Flavobacterium cauense R2A-7]
MKKKFLVGKIILLILTFALVSCEKEEFTEAGNNKTYNEEVKADSKGNLVTVFKGREVRLGEGMVRSWISVDANGYPREIGVEFTPEALKGLPLNSGHENTIVLPLHLKARELTPFDHIGLNWNPTGHDPQGVFTVPHFDVHFYMISVAERNAIPEWSLNSDAAFNNYPAKGHMPMDYITLPGAIGAEPQMGKHWLPSNLGAYLPFSKIMILGTYDGQFIFVEPMVTLQTLNNIRASMEFPYSQPDFFDVPGNYPTRYNIYLDPKTQNRYITLSEFVPR